MDRPQRFYEESVRALAQTMPRFEAEFAELSLNLALSPIDVQHSFLLKSMCRFGLAKSSFNVLMLLRRGPEEGMQTQRNRGNCSSRAERTSPDSSTTWSIKVW